jgi:hypothetical protein
MVIFRYYSGIQGDKMRQGKLFGVKNIMKAVSRPRLRYRTGGAPGEGGEGGSKVLNRLDGPSAYFLKEQLLHNIFMIYLQTRFGTRRLRPYPTSCIRISTRYIHACIHALTSDALKRAGRNITLVWSGLVWSWSGGPNPNINPLILVLILTAASLHWPCPTNS